MAGNSTGKIMAGGGCLTWLGCSVLGVILTVLGGTIAAAIGGSMGGYVGYVSYLSYCCGSLGFLVGLVGIILMFVGGKSED